MRKLRKKGFTLVEIMIVVAIIGLLAAIAIPNFVAARTKALANACIANTKQVLGAVQVWAIDTGAASNAVPGTTGALSDYIKSWPSCGGSGYGIPSVTATTMACPKTDSGHPGAGTSS